MIRNIIFDVGKVLVSYEPEAYMRKLGLDEAARAAVNQAMFENPLWGQADKGVMTPEEFLEAYIAGAPEYEKEIRLIHSTVGNTVELLPYVMDWIEDLKKRGYGIYILSNYGENMWNQTRDKMQFLSLADGAVFSYTCKMLKPEKEIYLYLCEKYGLIPEECVFIDDRQVNIEGGQKVGIQGILFKDYDQAKDRLEELLSFQKE